MARLEAIVNQIDKNELDIGPAGRQDKEANGIVAFCKEKLTRAEQDVEKMLSDKTECEE